MTLTTTISEMNRLYGVYAAAACDNDLNKAERAWREYFNYAKRYHKERGVEFKTLIHDSEPS
jgi:hypothetical protein